MKNFKTAHGTLDKLLSFKFDNSVKFNKPNVVVALPSIYGMRSAHPVQSETNRPDAKRHPAHFAGNRVQVVQQRPAHHQKNG
jgi:hypothetical protein